ncbi:hypothetical protein fugu_016334 [Takifugu bimaculatus]|uniref:Glycosyltransferase family 92 protein n=1 Tax=Takifugu bimaculatus TaxID=433685 RepID=A0A4Z2BSR4_9TELE|nr:hypothetical protein fugu_016334 [Takifugu bimaculatus]
MDNAKMKVIIPISFIASLTLIIFSVYKTPWTDNPLPVPRTGPKKCPLRSSGKTFTPLKGTKHLLVSAYMDQRVRGFDLRIIGIFRRDSIQALHCLFCCRDNVTTKATILPHSDNFGFPYVTTDVMCALPKGCSSKHVSLLTDQDNWRHSEQMWLPIRNLKTEETSDKRFSFTVCISTVFGRYNNVLQFAQSLEMYRLLGVNRVVVYNTSCGPELDQLLHSYSQEDFVEIVPWPIDEHLTPSYGWLHSESGGDVHYFGQQTSLNDCIYRSMERSRYVLLNDIDEIIMPYQQSGLVPLMDILQKQHPDRTTSFPKNISSQAESLIGLSGTRCRGINILEHIYREDPARNVYHPYKLIIQPRMVEQTSIHEVLKIFGTQAPVKVPPDVCRIIHTRVALRGDLTLEQLKEDKRLWDFSEKLIPCVDKALRKAGLLDTKDGHKGG